MKFSIRDFFSKYDQIRWKKSLALWKERPGRVLNVLYTFGTSFERLMKVQFISCFQKGEYCLFLQNFVKNLTMQFFFNLTTIHPT